MDGYLLTSAVYDPSRSGVSSRQVQRQTFNTIIEDEMQESHSYFSPRLSSTSTMSSPSFSDDFPTPRALPTSGRQMQQYNSPSPISEASSSPVDWKREHGDDFDELYDVTDDEAEEVPLKISNSVKRQVDDVHSQRSSRNRYPSIVIPSPSAWPTIEKLKGVTPMSPTGPMQFSHSPNLLSILSSKCLQVPARSATPSLDGSLTSEEMAELSCPSTPDIDARNQTDRDWTPGVQLRPEALETLHHLSTVGSAQSIDQVIELRPEAEMTEVSHAPAVRSVNQNNDFDADAAFSPLSVPSPGGFFSSLGDSARHTWSVSNEPTVPTTCIAEEFYGVPWRASEPVPQTVEITVDPPMDDCPTAKLTILSGSTEVEDEVKEIPTCNGKFEYNPNYEQELQKMANANIDRTGSWLNAQITYLDALRETEPLPTIDAESPVDGKSMHSRNKSLEATISPSKKSVRFLDEVPVSPASEESDKSPKETVFTEAFEFLTESAHKTDAYIHRQTRADAMHAQRRHIPTAHREQLLGRYEIPKIDRPAPPRPVSSFYTDDPTILKERIARAQKERQALEQVRPAVWVLQATKYLNGGKLLSQPAAKSLCKATNARVLDISAKGNCSWGWQAALEHEFASITTVSTASNMATSNIEGPSNHKLTVVPNYWTFPFPSGHFDVVSVRSLYSLLKTHKPIGSKIDELDLCLRECFRCLKPGGYLDFSLVDADIVHAGPLAQAASAEFSFNLKTRGYDAAPTKSFLPRLRKAGFDDVKRSWTFLPMGQTAQKWNDTIAVGAEATSERTISPEGDVSISEIGSTQDIAALTGLVGSWSWEEWLIKLQTEMGKDEERLLEGIPAVLEEASKTGAGWRQLSGWARKD